MQTLAPEAFEGTRLPGVAGLVAVCFHATWCGFCRAFLRLLREREPKTPLPFALADVSSLSDPRWDSFEIKVVPSLVLFKDGEPVWRKEALLGIGLREKDIDKLLEAAAQQR